MSSDGSDFVVQIEVLPNQGLYPNGIRPGENDANMGLEIIQNESDERGNVDRPYLFSFRATVTLPNGTRIVREIVNVLVIAPNCINPPNRDNTILAFQDFLLCDEDTDMGINRLILFLMIEHPIMGVPGTGLLNDIAYLEALRVDMLPYYAPLLTIKDRGQIMNELTGYVKRAVATNTFFYPRPERDDYPEPMILG